MGAHEGKGENHVLIQDFCDRLLHFPSMERDTLLLIASISGLQKAVQKKQWWLLTLGPNEGTHLADFFGTVSLVRKGQSPQAVLWLPGPHYATPFWLSSLPFSNSAIKISLLDLS